MLTRLFPKPFDNSYRGHWLGLFLFVPVVFVKGAQGITSMVSARNTMITADGIPLDTFSGAAVSTVTSMFVLLGMYLLILPVLSAVALIRYRAIIPFMYLMFLIVQVSARGLLLVNPIPRSSTAPIGSLVNLVVLGVTVIGLVLSLFGNPKRGRQG